MLPFPNIDPVLLQLGPLKIRWYGLMYVLGFMACYQLVKVQLKSIPFKQLQSHFENLNIVLILSLIIGGRLGYVVFYNLPYYLKHPLEIPATWSGGMSFHGATIGLIIGGLIFCRLKKIDFWAAADIYVVTIPIGLGLGRLGNFINGELFGKPTDVPWAMVFPHGGPLARHPSQLYEAFFEGLVLFVILWSLRKKPWQTEIRCPHGSLLALFLICYGIIRFLVEIVRQPDSQLGLLFEMVSMGQLLSLLMLIGGVYIWVWRIKNYKLSRVAKS